MEEKAEQPEQSGMVGEHRTGIRFEQQAECTRHKKHLSVQRQFTTMNTGEWLLRRMLGTQHVNTIEQQDGTSPIVGKRQCHGQ